GLEAIGGFETAAAQLQRRELVFMPHSGPRLRSRRGPLPRSVGDRRKTGHIERAAGSTLKTPTRSNIANRTSEAATPPERDLTDGVERSAIACPSVQQVIDLKV